MPRCKHLIKVGEPGFPVAAVDRGRTVVGKDIEFQVADHDFTKLKITPSVALLCDIPASIKESFYSGKVVVGLKNTAFQPFSPLRHMAELKQVLKVGGVNPVLKPILLLYTDGGPDHCITYVSVQASLICLFKALNLDYLVAMRTAPMQSYCNPVERIMSILNLAFQSVGVMRSEMGKDMEARLKKANSIAEVRQAAEDPATKTAVLQSVETPISLLVERITRLQLKGEPFRLIQPASDDGIDELWQEMSAVDPTLTRSDTTQTHIKSKEGLNEFFSHCCVRRQYFFSIKKCGEASCKVCGPTSLPPEVFASLHQFPDPVKSALGESYKPFSEVWGKITTKEARPSRCAAPAQSDRQHEGDVALKAESVRQVVLCSDCEKPRCIYSSCRLDTEQSDSLKAQLEEIHYVCGSRLFPENHALVAEVVVRSGISCASEVERAYYASKKVFAPVCFACGIEPPVPTPDELSEGFQSIHMPCATCQAKKKKPRTRGPLRVGASAIPSSRKPKHH